MPPTKKFKLSMFAAGSLIFARPHPSRTKRGEEIWYELF